MRVAPNRMIRFIKQYSHFSRPLQCQSTVRPKKEGTHIQRDNERVNKEQQSFE